MYHDTCYVAEPIIHSHFPSQTEVPEVTNTLSALVTGLVTKKIEIKIKIGTPLEN